MGARSSGHDRHHRQEGLREGRTDPRDRPQAPAETAGDADTFRTPLGRIESDFDAAPHSSCVLPDSKGGVARVLAGVRDGDDPWALASLPQKLPRGRYALGKGPVTVAPEHAAFSWDLGSYQFTRYKRGKRKPADLQIESGHARAPGARARPRRAPGARPREHAHRGHGARGPLRRRTRAGRALRRRVRRMGRRRAAGAELSGDPRRRPRRCARAAPARDQLGQPEASAHCDRRQGRVLRFRRPRHQVRRRHAPHEEGHGRGGPRDRARAPGDADATCRCACRCSCPRWRMPSAATPIGPAT